MSAPDRLDELLAEYGLEHLRDKCRALKFTLRAVLALEEADLSLITEFPGEKILLRSLIRDNLKNAASSVSRAGGSGGSSASGGASSCGGSSSGGSSGSRSSGAGSSSGGSGGASCSSGGSGGAGCSSGASSSGASSSSGSRSSGGGSSSTNSGSDHNNNNGGAAPVGGSKRRKPQVPAVAAKLQRIDEATKLHELDLELLISGDQSGGQHILEGYRRSVALFNERDDDDDDALPPVLSESQRDKIAEITVKYLLSLSEKPNHKLLPLVRAKIVELFPCETEETYYIAPKTESPTQDHPKGKLPNRIRNEKQRRKVLAAFDSSSTPSSSTSTIQKSKNTGLHLVLQTPVTDQMQAASRWLANGRTPWPLVIEKWVLTAPIRFRSIFQGSDETFINNYINEWPVLAHRSGYELVLEDFKLLQKNAESKLMENWDLFAQKTFSIASRDVKDKIMKKTVLEAMKIPQTPVNQNKLASVILNVLPYIRPNRFYVVDGKQVKATFDAVLNSYLLTVEKETDIKSAIQLRRAELNSRSGGGQPLIVIVGTDQKISSVHVSVATLRYRVESLVEAVDLFFKSFHVFHIPYPVESRHILTVLQRAIYSFNTEWDTDIPHSWIKACSC